MASSTSTRHFVISVVGAFVLAGASGCTGSIADEPGSTPAGGRSGGAGRSGSAAAGTTGGGSVAAVDPSTCGKVIRPGPAPIRRLNRFEYDNTIEDLLGDATSPSKAFPPEEIGNGFGNDATALGVSRLLADQYFTAAKQIAARLTADATRLATTLGCDPKTAGEDACATTFVDRFGARAYRRPLEAIERDNLLGAYKDARTAGGDFNAGVESVVATALLSPQFMYRIERGTPVSGSAGVAKLTSWELATRLSYMFWGTMPDAALFEAAKSGKLTTKADVRAQAERLLADARTKDTVRFFHSTLFGLYGLDRLMKNTMSFPTFFAELGPLLREESERFIESVTWDGAGDYATMLTAPYSFMNARLAQFYGVKGPTGTAFARVELDPTRHAGFMTSGGVMAALTPGTQSNPVLRGNYVRMKLLCNPPPDPPAALMVKEPMPDPTLTTRERFAAHQTEESCKGCHKLLDPIGFGFEHHDGIGQWRDTDNGKPVDARGNIAGTVDVDGDFNGAPELMKRLAGSAQVAACLTGHWMTFSYGRGFTEEDACTRASLEGAFTRSGGKVRDLLLALTETDAFLYKPVVAP